MKFYDVNCMIGEWTYKTLRFSETEDLLMEMDRLGIAKSLVFHSRSWLCDIKTGNETITQKTENNMHRLVPVISMTPLIEQEFGGRQSAIDYLKKNNIGAVRLFPSDHNYVMDLWNVEKLFSVLEEVNMPVLIEGRCNNGAINEYYSQIYELGSRYKSLNIILLTIGYRGLRTIYGLLDRCPNIYIDTSTFITYRGIEDTVKNFGAERILFGTRMPFIEGGVSVGRLIYADISDSDKEKIAGSNLLGMLNDNVCYNTMEGGTHNEA